MFWSAMDGEEDEELVHGVEDEVAVVDEEELLDGALHEALAGVEPVVEDEAEDVVHGVEVVVVPHVVAEVRLVVDDDVRTFDDFALNLQLM